MKKECAFFEDKLIEFALGEMEGEPELKKKVEEHTAICTDCWKKADSYRQAGATAKDVMRVDFTDEVWEMQRKEIIKRATYRFDPVAWVKKAVMSALTTRKLAAGFALLVFLAAGGTAGYRQYVYDRKIKAEKMVISKLDMLENMQILERLDFYRKMSEKRAQL